MLARLRSWWGALTGRTRFEQELDEELAFHLQARADDLMATGLTRSEALRRARIELGAVEAHKEGVRESRGLRFFDELRADLGFALRSWRKHLGLALAVTATLTLGIGLSTAGFSLIDVTFFRPHIAGDPRGHAQVWASYARPPAPADEWGRVEFGDLQAIDARARSLTRIHGHRSVSAPLGKDDPGEVTGWLMTCNPTSPVPPLLGRLLDSADCASAAPVMVLSEPLWRGRFGADPGVVGRALAFGRLLLTVVGVASATAERKPRPRVYLPYTLAHAFTEGPSWAQQFEVTARLADGHTRKMATAELGTIFAQQDRLHSGRKSAVVVNDGSHAQRPGKGHVIVLLVASMLMGVVAMIVLLVSANVVTLLLSRAHARRHEIAVRLSLGASRARLMKMLLTETLVLAGLAAALSLPLSRRLPALVLVWLEPGAIFDFPFDWSTWTFLLVVALLAAVSSGLAPALEALKVDLTESLKGSRVGRAGGRRGRDLRGLLIVGQIAFSVALLAGAALFVRGYTRLALGDPGFETRQALSASLRLRRDAAEPVWPAVHHALLADLGATAGIEAVAFSRVPPPRGQSLTVRTAGDRSRTAEANAVSAGFFDALRVPLLRGRSLRPGDPAAGGLVPVVVSERLASELWPGGDPLGQSLRGLDGEPFEVVGVAGNIFLPGRARPLALYRPLVPGRDSVLVRFAGDPAAALALVAAAIRRAAPGLDASPQTFQAKLDDAADELGRAAALALGLGVGALVLALIGVYGLVSFAARRRMKEMGIRLALGAQRTDILVALVRPVARRVGIGLLIGVGLAAAGSPALRPLVGDLDVGNPIAYAAAALLMAAVALLAMWRPARRAMYADPTATLRDD